MNKLKENYKIILAILIVGLGALIIGFFIGKNQLPAKVTTEVKQKEVIKEAVQEVQVANVKKTTTKITEKDGKITETTFDELNFASETNSQIDTTTKTEAKEVVKNNLVGVFWVPNAVIADSFKIQNAEINHAIFAEYGSFAAFGNFDKSLKLKNFGVGIGFRF